jgi:uncharacterized protein (TIGR02466 family)
VTAHVDELFATPLYQARLDAASDWPELQAELAAAVRDLAAEDRAGRAWCKAHGYRGYTSYASLDDLPRRAPVFADLRRRLDRHVAAFAEHAAFDLAGRRLRLDSLWVNLLRGAGAHSGHLHPHSVVSGTLYVETPPGSGAIRFEDPRLPMLMAAPVRTADAPERRRTFVRRTPEPGLLLLWESWLRHEVEPHTGRADRLSVSFNYR